MHPNFKRTIFGSHDVIEVIESIAVLNCCIFHTYFIKILYLYTVGNGNDFFVSTHGDRNACVTDIFYVFSKMFSFFL